MNLMTFCNTFSYAHFSFELITVFICFGIASGFRGARIAVRREHLLLSDGVFLKLENSFGERWVVISCGTHLIRVECTN